MAECCTIRLNNSYFDSIKRETKVSLFLVKKIFLEILIEAL